MCDRYTSVVIPAAMPTFTFSTSFSVRLAYILNAFIIHNIDYTAANGKQRSLFKIIFVDDPQAGGDIMLVLFSWSCRSVILLSTVRRTIWASSSSVGVTAPMDARFWKRSTSFSAFAKSNSESRRFSRITWFSSCAIGVPRLTTSPAFLCFLTTTPCAFE